MTIRIRDPLFSSADEIYEAPANPNGAETASEPAKDDNAGAAAHRRRLLGAATARRLERLDSTVEGVKSETPEFNNATIEGKMPTIAVVARTPKSKAADQIRRIRAALLARPAGNDCALFSVVALRNPNISEFLAVNVAASFAMAKRPTLLIDANVRRNGIATLFTLPTENSFGQAIKDGKSTHALPCSTTLEDLHVLTAGSVGRNGDEAFSVDMVKQILDSLKGHYEHVVVHAPPALTCASSRIILAATRQSLVAVQRNCDRVKNLRALCGIFRETDAQILGSILMR